MTRHSNPRQEIVKALVNLPAFQSENGRTAMLLTAGLHDVV